MPNKMNREPPALRFGSTVDRRLQYWLQEWRPCGWIDYGQKDTLEIARNRLKELKTEKSNRRFRMIVRVIEDFTVVIGNRRVNGFTGRRVC